MVVVFATPPFWLAKAMTLAWGVTEGLLGSGRTIAAGFPYARAFSFPRASVEAVRVAELWRFPVKSLQGERLDSVALTEAGLDGDRGWAIHDLDTGFGLTARRAPELLFASARLVAGGGVEITLPDGSVAADDAGLSAWLGRRVALRAADPGLQLAYENVVDFERESAGWKPFEGAPGPFHDDAAFRVSLVSTASLGAWDRRRFRANVVLDGEGEDGLVGARVELGGAAIQVGDRIQRCVMTTRAQPGGLERDLGVLRTIAREREARLAVGGLVVRPGTVRVGDRLITRRVGRRRGDPRPGRSSRAPPARSRGPATMVMCPA